MYTSYTIYSVRSTLGSNDTIYMLFIRSDKGEPVPLRCAASDWGLGDGAGDRLRMDVHLFPCGEWFCVVLPRNCMQNFMHLVHASQAT